MRDHHGQLGMNRCIYVKYSRSPELCMSKCIMNSYTTQNVHNSELMQKKLFYGK